MASKKNFRFSIIMTKQVFVRVRCWLETTTSSVDLCTLPRWGHHHAPLQMWTVDSAHGICIVSSLHTTALLITRHTHATTCAFYADCTYPRLGECPCRCATIDRLPDKWNVNSMFIIWMPPHGPLTDYIISSVLSSDTQASLMKRYVADVHITTPILSLIATAPLFLLFFLASSAFLIFSWRLKDLNLWTVGGVRFLNLHLGLLSLFSTIKVKSVQLWKRNL